MLTIGIKETIFINVASMPVKYIRVNLQTPNAKPYSIKNNITNNIAFLLFKQMQI